MRSPIGTQGAGINTRPLISTLRKCKRFCDSGWDKDRERRMLLLSTFVAYYAAQCYGSAFFARFGRCLSQRSASRLMLIESISIGHPTPS